MGKILLELLLNLCWMLLVGPAAAFWLRRTDRARSWDFGIALTCLLVLLFPVISATDDLHALQQEMEESTPCQGTRAGKHVSVHGTSGMLALHVDRSSQPQPCHEICGHVLIPLTPSAISVGTSSLSDRAPPPAPLA